MESRWRVFKPGVESIEQLVDVNRTDKVSFAVHVSEKLQCRQRSHGAGMTLAAKPFYLCFQALAKSLILRTVVVEQLACLAVARMPRPAPSSSVTRLCRSSSTGRP